MTSMGPPRRIHEYYLDLDLFVFYGTVHVSNDTPPKTNMEPENDGF